MNSAWECFLSLRAFISLMIALRCLNFDLEILIIVFELLEDVHLSVFDFAGCICANFTMFRIIVYLLYFRMNFVLNLFYYCLNAPGFIK
jgi:hypothetical protein